jgi:serine/threonine protein kinase
MNSLDSLARISSSSSSYRGTREGTASQPAQTSLAAGDVLAGKYEIVGLLGAGGMGTVWRARCRVLDIDVAIKVLRHDRGDEVAVERLRREARATARLGHPAIVRVFDFGETDAGEPFLVMELIEGQSLADWLSVQGRVPAELAVQMILPIAAGLAAAHAQGIVHRDVKTENILLARGRDGACVPKIVDFGIAKLSTRNGPILTEEGTILGSLPYMPPEQADGREVDEQADVWALCVVLYELIAGRRPFEGKTLAAVLVALHTTLPTPTTELAAGDAELWAIISHGLKKSRAARWHTMQALGEALALWAIERGVTADVMGASLQHCWLGRASNDFGPSFRALPALAESGVRQSALAVSLEERAPSGNTTQMPPRTEARRSSKRRVMGALVALVGLPVALGLVGLGTHGWAMMAHAETPITRPETRVTPPVPPATVTTATTVLESSGMTLDGAVTPVGKMRDGRSTPAASRKVSAAAMPLPHAPNF